MALLAGCLIAFCLVPIQAEEYTFLTVAGASGAGVDGSGSAVRFYNPVGTAVDATGNVYVADSETQTIRKITSAGVVTTLAGLATEYGSADGLGGAARFSLPTGVAVDSSNNVYVADSGNHTIRKITPARVVTTLAGLAGVTGSIDGVGPAARFNNPYAVAVDSAGNLYVADSDNHTIRKITPAGAVTTLAGSAGAPGSTDGGGSAARFNDPAGVAVDTGGNVYVADYTNYTVRKISPGGVVTTIAGQAGVYGSVNGTGTAALFSGPSGVAVDGSGNVFVTDDANCTIRKITAAGVVSTPAGRVGFPGSANGTGTVARFNYPSGISVNSAGTAVYISDEYNHTIRQLSGTTVTTLAGVVANSGSVDGTGSAARFYGPAGVALDSATNLYVADSDNHTIRKITPAGVTTTLAGLAGFAGTTNGTGNIARFRSPSGVALDSSNNDVYVADTSNHAIRKVTAAGVVTTFAGLPGTPGNANGTTTARFRLPGAVAVDTAGSVYVADTGNHTIRKITSGCVVSTLAGLAGTAGAVDATGTAARFSSPAGVAVDGSFNVYVTDYGNSTVRKITSAGVVTTLAGLAGASGDTDGIGSAARFDSPQGVVLDSVGNLFVSDEGYQNIRKITPAGVVTTVGGLSDHSGNADGTGADARFYYPEGMAIDSAGNLYVADYGNSTIRKGTPPCLDAPTIDAVVGLKNGIRQLDTTPQTAVSRQWSIIRWPANSLTQLSSATLRNPTFTPDAADLYVMRLTTTNASGQIAIRTLQFTAFDPVAPTIITQPAVQPIAAAGDTITLRVAAFGGLPLQYQWQRNGIDIVGATGLNLTLTNAQADQSGAYTVVVTNTYDVTTSSSTQLTIVAGSLTDFTVVGGLYTFTLHWLDGLAVTAEYSSNLVDWIPFATATVSGGSVQFTDPSTTTDPQRFYRVRR